jgi:hypothetical protein
MKLWKLGLLVFQILICPKINAQIIDFNVCYEESYKIGFKNSYLMFTYNPYESMEIIVMETIPKTLKKSIVTGKKSKKTKEKIPNEIKKWNIKQYPLHTEKIADTKLNKTFLHTFYYKPLLWINGNGSYPAPFKNWQSTEDEFPIWYKTSETEINNQLVEHFLITKSEIKVMVRNKKTINWFHIKILENKELEIIDETLRYINNLK